MGQKAGFDGDGAAWKVFWQCSGENEQKKRNASLDLMWSPGWKTGLGGVEWVGMNCRAGTGSLNTMEENRSHL